MADIYEKALNDSSDEIRSMAVKAVDGKNYMSQLNDLALNDPTSHVRASALKKSGDYEVAKKLIRKDQSFRVIGEALSIINKKDPAQAISELANLAKSYHKPLIPKMAEIYAHTKDEKYLSFFENNIENVGTFGFFNYMNQYSKIADKASPEKQFQTAQVLKNIALEDSNTYFKKYSATNLINSMVKNLQSKRTQETSQDLEKTIDSLKDVLTEIVNKSNETRLKSSFKEYLLP